MQADRKGRINIQHCYWSE